LLFCAKYNVNNILCKRAFFEGNPSLIQIKEEITRQIEMKEILKVELPETITIGLFLVNVEPLKKILVDKRNNMANLIMSTHASKTIDQLESCCSEFKGIYIRLGETAASIEQVFETRDWIDTLPTIIENISAIVKRLFVVITKIYYLLIHVFS
jgi:dynein heavy chain